LSFDQLPIPGPFKGIVDNQPRPTKDPKAWDDLFNMFVYEGRLITRPRLNNWGNTPDGAVTRLMQQYTDLLGHKHNLVLTTKTAYAVTSGPTYNTLTIPYGIPDLSGTSLPYGYAIINGRVYFSNGSKSGFYADGSDSLQDPFASSGSSAFGWRFAAVLGNHLVTCNTTEPPFGTEGSTNYQSRVRWSASGDPNDWTVGAGSTAGFEDLLEVPDAITGIATLGRSGYIFRTNGITLMTPTGVGVSPFQFDQVTNSPQGVGNFYPYSLATYGNVCAFVSNEEIYAFDGSSFSPIGAEAKKLIFADIGNTSDTSIYGFVVPKLGAGFPFLSYWLSLPSSVNGTAITWIYSWASQAWQRFASVSGQITAISNLLV